MNNTIKIIITFTLLTVINLNCHAADSSVEIETLIYKAMAARDNAKSELIDIIAVNRKGKIAEDIAFKNFIEQENELSFLKEKYPEFFDK